MFLNLLLVNTLFENDCIFFFTCSLLTSLELGLFYITPWVATLLEIQQNICNTFIVIQKPVSNTEKQ